MALKGDTSNLLLADIFQTLFQNGQSGVLKLHSESADRHVAFAPHGVTLLDATAFRGERLGELLVAGNVVAQGTIDAALKELARLGGDPFSSIKLLVVLDEDGHLPLARGVSVLRTEVREELFEVFTLDRMEFEFVENDVPNEGIPRECYFRPEEVVMEAARRVDEWSRIREVVGSGDRYYVVAPGVDATGIEGVVERLDGSNTTRDIAEALLVSRFEVARVVWQLLEANQLRPATIDELLRAARSLDANASRARIEKIVRRAASMVNDSDERIDDAAEIAVAANVRDLATELLVRRARALLVSEHPEAAYTEALRARELDPLNRGVLELLAEIHGSRGEREAEVKILTLLAERAATEKRYDAAVEYGCRVAALMPDSPLLDHAFAIHCQNANRVAQGVEALSRAAGLRTTKAGMAQLYRAILVLDPLRGDVRKMLSRVESRRRRGRLAAIVGATLLVPVLGAALYLVMGLFDRQHLRGQVEAAERLVATGEWKAARSTLDGLAGADVDDETAMTIVRLRRTVDERLAERAEVSKASTLQAAREELAATQEALVAGEFATAVERLIAIEQDTADLARENLVTAKRKVLANSLTAAVRRLESLAGEYSEPKDDAAVVQVLERFGADFSAASESEFRKLASLAPQLETDPNWKDLASRIRSDADRGLAAIMAIRPRLADVEARRERATELDLLSGDYEQVLAAESRGDFATASEGYARLVREYGEGTLTQRFTERRDETATIATALADIRARAERGEIEAAAGAMTELFANHPEVALAKIVGMPRLVDSIPTGATVSDSTGSLGRTPFIGYAKAGSTLEITLAAPGFESAKVSLDPDGTPRVAVELRRERGFEVAIDATVDVAPAISDRYAFVAARDGVVHRIRRSDGTLDGRLDTGSLAGACLAPVLVANTLVVALGEGKLVGIDPERLTIRFAVEPGSRAVGHLTVDGERVLVATSAGSVATLDVALGTLTTIATFDCKLSTGPVRLLGRIAVGTADGELIACAESDGAVAFKTAKLRQPATGVVAAATRFVLATDDGTLSAFDATSGEPAWSRTSDAALSVAPRVHEGLLLVGAGEHALVLDAESGELRCDVVARDWLSASPTLAGGRLYLCDRTGALDVFDLATATRIFRHALGAPSRATPTVVADGVLVVTERGVVSIVGS